MSRFRKVHLAMHADMKYRELSSPQPNGKSLWIHLIAGPHTGIIPGLSAKGEASLADDLDWPLEGFRKVFLEVSGKGMVMADWKAKVVWVPNAIKYNEPESPNVIKAWAKAWKEIPECRLKDISLKRLRSHVDSMPIGFRKVFNEVFPKPSANQEHEQEQEQEQENKECSEPVASATNSLPASKPEAESDADSPGIAGRALEPGIDPALSTDWPNFPTCAGKKTDATTWLLTETQIAEWKAVFSGIDVAGECRKAHAWVKANMDRKKTASGMLEFLRRWLARAQNTGGSPANLPQRGQGDRRNGYSRSASRAGEYDSKLPIASRKISDPEFAYLDNE